MKELRVFFVHDVFDSFQKKVMRCVAIDGRRFLANEKLVTEKISQVADCILDLRSLGEDPEICSGRHLSKKTKCATVLILMDNADDNMAKHLAAKLHDQTLKNGIAYDSPLFVLIHVCSSADFEAISNSDEDAAGVTSDDSQILQKLDDKEIRMFQTRLKSLIDQNCNVEDMMSFVIMAENFDENSEYVKKVVLVSFRRQVVQTFSACCFLSILPYQSIYIYTKTRRAGCSHATLSYTLEYLVG